MSLEQALAENTTALRELLAILQANPAAVVQPVVNVVVEKATTKTTEKPAATKGEATQKPQTTEDAPQVEYSQIQALVPKIATTAEGTEMVKALFARFGVKRGPELKTEQYAGFYADLVRIQAGEFDPRTAEV